MFERLKSLPLTIVLTILIWMYAESQVNSTHSIAHLTVDVPVRVTGSPETLARYDVAINPQDASLNLTGPPEQIDALRRETPVQGVYAFLDLNSDDRPAGASLLANSASTSPRASPSTSPASSSPSAWRTNPSPPPPTSRPSMRAPPPRFSSIAPAGAKRF